MKIFGKLVLMSAAAACVFWCASLLSQRSQLSGSVIRLHVVANSDTRADQDIKLRLRDAVTAFLQDGLEAVENKEEALAFLRGKLPEIENLANGLLQEWGCEDSARVSLGKEAFDTRFYDTFTMPAGVYESLRIIIGEGAGKNWWCVLFPEFCVSATAAGFSERAVECGYSDSLTGALTGEEGYEVRFFLLDCLGRVENFFFGG